MRIAIGGIVRNRAWVLPEYLAALSSLQHDDKEYIFLENDSDDDSWDILYRFCYESMFHHESTRKRIKGAAWSMKTGAIGWDRYSANSYRDDDYKNLADVRNNFIKRFLDTKADYLFSVDSDIIVQPDTLSLLLEEAAKEPGTIVGAVICNVPDQDIDGHAPCNFMIMGHPGVIYAPDPYPLQGIMDVFVTGAVYLIPRKVLEAGVRYGPDSQGEDIYFCRRADEKGFKRKVVLHAQCEHRMKKKE